ncbi:baseplate J/gp47 family protein [Mesorhizobium sp. KR1-2]|uniref:baseplate J/gp47 family protein n=1 Tax=Mesorhizobium sp. KR1-2 TaxID=3156609 RepID=UPI0032B3311B
MPFARPSPQEIRDRISTDVVRFLGGAAALMRRSLEWVLVRMLAVASHELHGHLSWISRQVLVDQADDEELERHANIWGIRRQAAVRAHGRVTFTGTASATVPGGTELRRSDDQRYFVDASVEVGSAGTIVATVTAALEGAAGNAPIGAALQLVTPLVGIQNPARVADDGSGAGLSGGRESESDASMRARILSRIQQPPHGGARHDYVSWVREVVGDTLVWVYPNQLGLGTVVIAFVMPNGTIPTASVVSAVQAHVNEERPVTADVTVVAPVIEPLDMLIRLSPDTALVRAAVLAELGEMIMREATPGGTLPISRLSAAISAASGEYSHNLLSPTADVVTGFGRITRLGTVTWVVE